ncbi:MAG: hypothetical protein ACYC0V_08025 [Armatimonadota bacterium]
MEPSETSGTASLPWHYVPVVCRGDSRIARTGDRMAAKLSLWGLDYLGGMNAAAWVGQ